MSSKDKLVKIQTKEIKTMTCKDCFHYEACSRWYVYTSTFDDEIQAKDCKQFKHKSECMVLPCSISTTIYMLVTKRPKMSLPEFTFIKETKLTFMNMERVINDFGEKVFLTKTEAEQKLKELNYDK